MPTTVQRDSSISVRQTGAVSPRPAPTRYDDFAMVYLNAAARLIDASLTTESEVRTPRLRALHYPAALDWIRIEDVLRMAQEGGRPASKRALLNRWPTKDEFIRDAVVHAMLYRDDPAGDPTSQVSSLQNITGAASFSAGVAEVVDNLIGVLISHPRSFLLAHIAALLPRHPGLASDLQGASNASQLAWSEMYRDILLAMDVKLRKDWSIDRLTLAIQLVIDGAVMRSRIQPDHILPSRWESASIYADTVLAVISGALDPERDGLTLQEWLNRRMDRAAAMVRSQNLAAVTADRRRLGWLP